MVGKKRSKDLVIAQILQVCIQGANKTRIVYLVNLNFRTIVPYLDSLVGNGLLSIEPGEISVYKTTQKGINTLQKLKEVQELLGQPSFQG